MFESGGCKASPKRLTDVMAMSAGNSIFVAGSLLSDPASDLPASAVRRIVGNIGSPGISLLVVPESELRIRKASDDFMAVTHADYDHKRENNFESTSLHLSFTGWKVPLLSGTQGFIDEDIHLLEAVVAARDRGAWIADIDVLGSLSTIKSAHVHKIQNNTCVCDQPLARAETDLISLDAWDELLDAPNANAIVRSHGNWVGRLATACVAQQMFPYRLIVLATDDVCCWRCFGMGNSQNRLQIVID